MELICLSWVDLFLALGLMLGALISVVSYQVAWRKAHKLEKIQEPFFQHIWHCRNYPQSFDAAYAATLVQMMHCFRCRSRYMPLAKWLFKDRIERRGVDAFVLYAEGLGFKF